ncbi:MAG: zinc ribbon domain-containing protein [Nitrospirota bacterium]|jgi:putative FmdB family regulatory protein
MPVYEYVCNSCSRTFSIIKLSLSDTETACPDCGSKDVTKKFSTFSCGVSAGSLSPGRSTGGG